MLVVYINILLQPLLQSDVDPNKFNNFMLLGYFAMWLVVMAYLVLIFNRQRNTEEEIELLEKLLREDEEGADW